MNATSKIDRNNNSRFSAITLALGLTMAAAMPVHAQQVTEQGKEWTAQKSSIMAGASIAGAVIAGPVGFVLGVAAGDWLGDSVNKATTADDLARERDRALAELVRVQEALVVAEMNADRYQELALDSLQLNVMFSTADANLTPRDMSRLDILARLLKEQSQLNVQLAGFADPRGADAYNVTLSERRAESVRTYLENKGIATHRIQSQAYGSQRSEAQKNNLDAYAMERVVTIELQENSNGFAVSE